MTDTLPSVKLDNFEGPFDLLLTLAQSRQIDLSTISLAAIADAFIAYLTERAIPTSLQADWLVVAATLVLVKLSQLMPTLTVSEEDEVQELTDRLRIYQLFRDQAKLLRQQWDVHPMLPGPPPRVLTQISLPDIAPADLGDTLMRLLQRLAASVPPTRHLRLHGRTLAQCLEHLSQRVARLKQVVFQEELRGENAQTVAVSFLAALELTRRGRVQLQQDAPLAPLRLIAAVE